MLRSFRLFLGALLAGAPLALGCVALLGDFELRDEGGGAGGGSATGTGGYTEVTTGESGASGGGVPFPPGSGSVLPSTAAGSGFPFPCSDGGFPLPCADGGFPFPDLDSGLSYPVPDPGGSDPCGTGSTAEISNDFDATVIDSRWWSAPQDKTAPVYAEQVWGELHLVTHGPPDFGSLLWKGPMLSLRDCHVSVQVKQVVDESLDVQTGIDVDNGLEQAVRSSLRIAHSKGKIRFRQILKGTSTTEKSYNYDPNEHAFWRVREKDGHVLFQASPDGQGWKTWYQVDTDSFVDAVRVRLFISSNADTTANASMAKFDNLNPPQ